MSRPRKLFQAVFIICAVFTYSASIAYAQEGVSLPESTPWTSVDVTAHKEQASEILIIRGELSEQASRPARVELAVPSGSQLRWIGEILGGDPNADPEVEYEVITSGNSDVYRFTLMQSHTGQIEVVPPRPAVVFDGSVYSAKIEWTPSQVVPDLHLSVTLPLGAQVQQPDEGASVETQSGNSRYSKDFTDVSAEETASLEFTYTAPDSAPAGRTGPVSDGGGVTGLLLFVAGAGLGALIVLLWRKQQQSAGVDDRAGGRQPGTAKDRPKPVSRASEAARTRSTNATGLSARAKLMMAAAGLVGGTLVFMIVVNGDVGTVRTTDAGVTKVLTGAEADQVVSVPGLFQPGSDIQHEASHVFESLEGLSGIGAVTVSNDGSTIDVEYVSSRISGESITAMLEAAGYAAPSPTSADR